MVNSGSILCTLIIVLRSEPPRLSLALALYLGLVNCGFVLFFNSFPSTHLVTRIHINQTKSDPKIKNTNPASIGEKYVCVRGRKAVGKSMS